ncbi:MAG: hypothetical protein ACI85K_003742 [Hyphomicrobiaceae bacterium]|jgi:hypothetical protein
MQEALLFAFALSAAVLAWASPHQANRAPATEGPVRCQARNQLIRDGYSAKRRPERECSRGCERVVSVPSMRGHPTELIAEDFAECCRDQDGPRDLIQLFGRTTADACQGYFIERAEALFEQA